MTPVTEILCDVTDSFQITTIDVFYLVVIIFCTYLWLIIYNIYMGWHEDNPSQSMLDWLTKSKAGHRVVYLITVPLSPVIIIITLVMVVFCISAALVKTIKSLIFK